jgi:pimeloyl-ACP methyl ester carboxylesterase
MQAGSLDLEVLRRGSGPPLLLIHGVNPISPRAAFVDALADGRSVVAPSHPGFGASPRPADFDTMYDLVHCYLDVLEAIGGERIDVVGFGFGGWIAAELATLRPPRLGRLVLVDAVGIKIGPRDERDFAHFFNTDPGELDRRAWHHPAQRPAGVYGLGWQARIDDTMSDAEMITLARNWDSLCLYGWRPHMFNPQLAWWLRRIAAPTLVLWGGSDRVVPPEYGRGYAGLIPGARFATIPAAGHHPELEQPRPFVDRVTAFLRGEA